MDNLMIQGLGLKVLDFLDQPISVEETKASDRRGHNTSVTIPTSLSAAMTALRERHPKFKALEREHNDNSSLARIAIHFYLRINADLWPELDVPTVQDALDRIQREEWKQWARNIAESREWVARLRELGRHEEADRQQARTEERLAAFDDEMRGYVQAVLAEEESEKKQEANGYRRTSDLGFIDPRMVPPLDRQYSGRG